MSVTDSSSDALLAEAVDRMVAVSVDLKRFAQWFEEHRVEWAEAGLRPPYFRVNGAYPEGRVSVSFVCITASELLAAARLLEATSWAEQDAVIEASRSWGSVLVTAYASRRALGDDFADLALRTAA